MDILVTCLFGMYLNEVTSKWNCVVYIGKLLDG